VIFDEPTAGQDQKALQRLAHLIQTLQQNEKTVITITHDIEFVVQSFQRVIVMAQKKVVADGDRRQILWDFDVLQQAALHQPHISRVYRALEMGDAKVLDIPELVAELQQLGAKRV
jgi:energy-coupling factor transport system ATP-binding protein